GGPLGPVPAAYEEPKRRLERRTVGSAPKSVENGVEQRPRVGRGPRRIRFSGREGAARPCEKSRTPIRRTDRRSRVGASGTARRETGRGRARGHATFSFSVTELPSQL